MKLELLGKKLGMSQVYDSDNNLVPVTIIEAGPCPVLQIKTIEKDGYNAVQIGYNPNGKSPNKTNACVKGHAKKANVDLLICRNALSCYIALNARKYMANNSKPIICYDGRGALKAEAAEFKVYPESFKTTLFRAERASVLHSDFRIAVTKELVEWWNMEYGYNSENHAIIPTTISTQVQEFDPKKNRTGGANILDSMLLKLFWPLLVGKRTGKD